MAVKRTDGKWWTDKDPEKRFATMEQAREVDDLMPDKVEPKVREVPKATVTLHKEKSK